MKYELEQNQNKKAADYAPLRELRKKIFEKNRWIQKKEYWIKRGKHYGTWLWNKKT